MWALSLTMEKIILRAGPYLESDKETREKLSVCRTDEQRMELVMSLPHIMPFVNKVHGNICFTY